MTVSLVQDNELILSEMFAMMTGGGESIVGSGSSRIVYDIPYWLETKKPIVLKVANNDCAMQNVLEYETWSRVQDIDVVNKWFAPVLAISHNHKILVMEKTEPVPKGKYPEKIPAFFTDTKRANFGWYKNRLVCHDYGVSMLMEKGATKRMQKAEWWDG